MALFKTDKINSSENQSNEKEKTNKKNTGKENVKDFKDYSTL